MTPTVLAISAAYVVLGVLLLALGLAARLSWWVKAAALSMTAPARTATSDRWRTL